MAKKQAAKKAAPRKVAKKTASAKKPPPKPKATVKAKDEPSPQIIQLVKHKADTYQMVDTPYGHMGVKCKDNARDAASICAHNLPLIPLELFWSILCWQRAIAKEHSCESSTSLFLIDGQWVAEPFYQQNTKGSMTIKTDYESDENKELYRALANASHMSIHATIHNHVNSPAHQSGTDEADETGLPGPHITIGNMNQQKIDWHARFSVFYDNKHHFVPLRVSDIIELPLPKHATLKQIELAEELIRTSVPEVGWPDDWNDKFSLKTTMGKGTASAKPKDKSTTKSGPNTTEVSSEDIGEEELTLDQVAITHFPWSMLVVLDCENWADFKISMVEHEESIKKAMTTVLANYACSPYEVFCVMSAAKLANNLPLNPPSS